MRTDLLRRRTLSLAWAVCLLCCLPGGQAAAFSQQGRGSSAGVVRADSASLRGQALKAVRERRFEAASELMRRGRRIADRFEKDAWHLVEAELDCARGRFARGGLAAMRVVILRSTSLHVGRALYWAGRSYEGLDRPEKARELYEACMAHETSSESTRKIAGARLAALTDRKPASPETPSSQNPQQTEATRNE